MDLHTLLTRKNIIGIIIALILLIAIPLGIYLAQKTQIFKPRATSSATLTILDETGRDVTGGPFTAGRSYKLKFNLSDATRIIHTNVLSGVDKREDALKPGTAWYGPGCSDPSQPYNGPGYCPLRNDGIRETTAPFYVEWGEDSANVNKRMVEATPPSTTLTVTDTATNGSVALTGPFVTGKRYKVKVEATDNSVTDLHSGIKVFHTAGRSNVSSETEAKTPISEWNASYIGIPNTSVGEREFAAPFYFEVQTEDINKNLEPVKKLLATATADNIKPSGRITANPAGPFTRGQSVELTFTGTDDGGTGVKVLHTTIWEDVSNKREAIEKYKNAQGELVIPAGKEHFYQGFSASTGKRTATVPFYAELAVEDNAGNIKNADEDPTNQQKGTATTSDTIKPTSTIISTPAANFTDGQEVTLDFAGTDTGGSGVGVIHTTIWEGVSTKEQAIARYHNDKGELIIPAGKEHFYQGFSAASGRRTARVPFYAEARAQDREGNVQDPETSLGAPEFTDCTLTSGPASVRVGDTATYTATYTSNRVTYGEINVWNSSNQSLADLDGFKDWINGPGKYSMDPRDEGNKNNKGNSITFTPRDVGTFRVACRSTNSLNLECHGGGIGLRTGQIACPSGASSYKIVEVIPGGGPTPSPSVTPPPSISPSPSAAPEPVVSIKVDPDDPSAVNADNAIVGEVSNLPIRINTAITRTVQNVSAIDLTFKYNTDEFEFVNLTVHPTSGLNTNCSRTGAGPGAFCKILPIPSNGTVQLSTSIPAGGGFVVGDPIVANLRLRAKKKVDSATIELNDVSVVGPNPGVYLGVAVSDHVLPIKEKTFTRTYQVCEANGDLETMPSSALCSEIKPYKNYRSTGKVIDKDYEIRDKTPGLKTIFVKFVSTADVERTEKVLINYQPTPSITGGVTCNFSGEGMEAVIIGTNFYERSSGSVKINNIPAEIIEWTDQVVVLSSSPLPATSPSPSSSIVPSAIPSPSPGSGGGVPAKLWKVRAKINRSFRENVPVELNTAQNGRATGSCQVGVTSLDFSVLSKCGPLPTNIKEDVEVSLFEKVAEPVALVKSKVKVDGSGRPQSFTPPALQKDKDYVLVVKTAKTLSRKVEFKARSNGTTVLEKIEMPVGNIAPANNPDSKINSLDRSELVRQWSLTTNVVRAGDFNEDGRINSIDWSCMRENFNKEDETFTGVR